MIAADQPSCFPSDLLVAVSSRDDGTMLDRSLENRHDPSIVANRTAFCAQAGANYENTAYQIILYDENQSYDTIAQVDKADPEGVCADALYTEMAGVGLFLPVADCVATIVYDPERKALTSAHLGRHASIAKLMTKLVNFMIEKGSDASNLIVWMAPSVGRDSYRMDYFDHLDDPDWAGFAVQRDGAVYLDLAGFNAQLANNEGVPVENIHTSSVDTATDTNYFSHSQGDSTGRFAVFSQITLAPTTSASPLIY